MPAMNWQLTQVQNPAFAQYVHPARDPKRDKVVKNMNKTMLSFLAGSEILI